MNKPLTSEQYEELQKKAYEKERRNDLITWIKVDIMKWAKTFDVKCLEMALTNYQEYKNLNGKEEFIFLDKIHYFGYIDYQSPNFFEKKDK